MLRSLRGTSTSCPWPPWWSKYYGLSVPARSLRPSCAPLRWGCRFLQALTSRTSRRDSSVLDSSPRDGSCFLQSGLPPGFPTSRWPISSIKPPLVEISSMLYAILTRPWLITKFYLNSSKCPIDSKKLALLDHLFLYLFWLYSLWALIHITTFLFSCSFLRRKHQKKKKVK